MDTQKLRQRILDLAIRGKLVPQDPNDEPASVLLDRIRAEKERLIAEGKIKRPKSKKSTDKSHYQHFTPPFEIPESWKWVSLPEVCRIPITDGTHKTPIYSDKENGVPFLSSKDVTTRQINWDNIKFIDRKLHEELYSRLAPKRYDILLAKNGTTGVAAMVDTDAVFDIYVTLALIRPMIPFVYPKYLLYVINSDLCKAQFNAHLTGIGLPNLHLSDINKTIIPLPPIEEQIKIANEIDIWFSSVNMLEQNKEKLYVNITLAKSKILDLAMQGKLVPQDPADEPAADMLLRINPKAKIITDNPHYPQLPDNWVLTTVESVCNYGYSENVGVDNIESLDWVLELEDIEKDSGRIITKKVKQERAINGVRHRFAKDNVLYSKLRTYLNKVLVAPTDGYCTTEIIPVKSSDCVIPEYLCAWLRSPFFLSYTAECCYGVKMPRLSTTDARKGIIPLPPINEQKRIIQKLNEISTSLECLSNSLS